MKTSNARIVSTMLGAEDHGILSAWIQLDYGNGGQSFGGYALDGKRNDELKMREPSVVCGHFIRRVLQVVGVESWEKLPDTPCRVVHEQGKVHAIGHYLKEEWFNPTDEFKRYTQ